MVVRFEVLRNLPSRDKRLVLSAIWLLWNVRFSSWLSPMRALETYHRLPVERSSSHRAPVYQLLWAIEAAVRFVPKTTSLTQALAAKTLLARYGYDSKLHVGVAKEEETLQAHAWLSQGGAILLGEVEDLSKFRPLSSVKGQKTQLVWRSLQ
jgi:Transglutaminase-like superfamily